MQFRKHPLVTMLWILSASSLGIQVAHGAGVPTLDTVEVQSTAEDLIGAADSANQGTVIKSQLDARTTYRPGEMLETVPGLIVTQHSGEGKAGQYYLRGFNLDHGTDMRTTIDGMLVNQRSHGHGQGWTDLNFFIPELAAGLQYKKGPYYAEEGDFASAGAVSIQYLDTLPQGLARLTLGQNGNRRLLVADSPSVGQGHVLYALELFKNDGPFTQPDDYRKLNGVLRYSQGDAAHGFNLTAMAYRALWDATDQIPQRAVDSGMLSRWDTIDTSDGGEAYRYSLSGAWHRSTAAAITKANAYLIAHKLNLFSNFTYFMDDPVNGDQFKQNDKRFMSAVNLSHTLIGQWQDREMENTFGVQFQNDNVFNGLHHTRQRQVLSTTRADHFVESSLGVYVQNSLRWNDYLRSVAGLRGDYYRSKVRSDNPLNSGDSDASILSPKLSLIFGPWAKTEYYVNLGRGFHSNDARGTTLTVDPASGDPADRVSALVRSKGYEVGLRTAFIPRVQSVFSVYALDFDSELVFSGDAGTTEAGRPSRRVGFEFANFYTPTEWLTIDADIAYARARFRGADPSGAGDYIPGAVEGVASLGASVDHLGSWFGGIHLRYFGPRALIEDNSVRSDNTTLLNATLGYKISKRLSVDLEVFNLLNSKANAIDYYYESQLASESAPVADKHFHPIESRSLRVTLSGAF